MTREKEREISVETLPYQCTECGSFSLFIIINQQPYLIIDEPKKFIKKHQL